MGEVLCRLANQANMTAALIARAPEMGIKSEPPYSWTVFRRFEPEDLSPVIVDHARCHFFPAAVFVGDHPHARILDRQSCSTLVGHQKGNINHAREKGV
jgi:hypothetical protein